MLINKMVENEVKSVEINTHKLTVRGQSHRGVKSYALPLSRQELREFGVALDHADDLKLAVTVTKGKIVAVPVYDEDNLQNMD